MPPLVSCVMLTRARPEWAAQAIAAFNAQTWANRELVILDDAHQPSFEQAPQGAIYSRSDLRVIGAKRNAANAHASGEFICTWDDDDYSSPVRIEAQMAALDGAQVCGMSDLDFVDENGEEWTYPGHPHYAPGSTLLYSREFWARNPFDVARHIDEEKEFQSVAFKARQLVMIPAEGLMKATIHRGNTSFRDVTAKPWRKKAA